MAMQHSAQYGSNDTHHSHAALSSNPGPSSLAGQCKLADIPMYLWRAAL